MSSKWLKQSTAATVKIGPFRDSTDGDTAETALTITQADVRLSKQGGAFAQKNDATSCTHDADGYYDCPLNTTDTNSLGSLVLSVHEAGALTVRHEFVILPANVHDSLVAGSDKLECDNVQFGGTNGTYASGRPEVNTSHAAGTAWGSGAITAAVFAADAITAAKVAADVGTEIGTAVWATAARTLTANTNLNDLSAAGVRSALGLASANLDTQLSAIAAYIDTEVAAILAAVDTEVAAIKAKTDNLPAAPAATGDCLTAAGVRAAVGLASANLDTQLAAIDDFVDTEVAAIKAVLDKLDTALVLDGAVYQFTANALELAPSAAGSDLMILRSGTAQAGAAGSITLDVGAPASNDSFDLSIVAITGGTGAGQSRQTDGYDGTSKVLLVATPWAIVPDNTSVFAVVPGGYAAATVENIVAGVWNALRADYALADTFGEYMHANVRLVSDNVSAADRMQQVFDGTGGIALDANITQVNSVAVDGTGTDADPFKAVGT